MLREQCRVGMVIEFGRENGQKTKGQIIKLNPKMAKVKTFEARGQKSGEGAIWNVGYGLMTEVKDITMPMPTVEEVRFNPADADYPYNRFAPYGDICIMEAIVDTYNRLSPEWLTADGERPANQIHALRGNLQRKLDHLFKALGRPVSESVAYKWYEQKKAA